MTSSECVDRGGAAEGWYANRIHHVTSIASCACAHVASLQGRV
jgi:hypothetical protein